MNDGTVIICTACGDEIGTVDVCSARPLLTMKDGSERAPVFHADPSGARCAACGVAIDNVHHVSCPRERCPACHGPLQKCGCIEAAPPEEVVLTIKYRAETNQFGVFGPLADRILCYGLLERARDFVQHWKPPAKKAGLALHKPEGGNGQ